MGSRRSPTGADAVLVESRCSTRRAWEPRRKTPLRLGHAGCARFDGLACRTRERSRMANQELRSGGIAPAIVSAAELDRDPHGVFREHRAKAPVIERDD